MVENDAIGVGHPASVPPTKGGMNPSHMETADQRRSRWFVVCRSIPCKSRDCPALL